MVLSRAWLQDDVVSKMLQLSRADPSEFVRRAVLNFISQFCCTGSLMFVAFFITVSQALVHDVDCDVKCAAVKFLRRYLSHTSQLATSLCCQSAILVRGIGCLLSAVSDCDRPVRLEALETLIDVRRLAATQPDFLLPLRDGLVFDGCSSGCDGICKNSDFVGKLAGLANPRLQDGELFRDEATSQAEVNCADAGTDQLSTNDDNVSRRYSKLLVTRLRVSLLTTDWNSMLASELEQCGDCHVGNPSSLLDDILKTVRRDSAVSDENTSDSDDRDDQDPIIIDCY